MMVYRWASDWSISADRGTRQIPGRQRDPWQLRDAPCWLSTGRPLLVQERSDADWTGCITAAALHKAPILSGTYHTQELPCGIRLAVKPWPVKKGYNISSSSWPQGRLSLRGPQGARAVWWVPLIPDISLFSLLHAPSAPQTTVANHLPLAEIVLPSKFSG